MFIRLRNLHLYNTCTASWDYNCASCSTCRYLLYKRFKNRYIHMYSTCRKTNVHAPLSPYNGQLTEPLRPEALRIGVSRKGDGWRAVTMAKHLHVVNVGERPSVYLQCYAAYDYIRFLTTDASSSCRFIGCACTALCTHSSENKASELERDIANWASGS